jgi:hypothetical protein
MVFIAFLFFSGLSAVLGRAVLPSFYIGLPKRKQMSAGCPDVVGK